MSGFVAAVRFDGAPVDAALVAHLTERIRDRGPDGEGSWSGGGAALVHTLLECRTGSQPAHPFVTDRLVVVFDGRLDARADDTTPDSELVVRAYETWGEDAPAHLIGDFAFGIWDRAARRLYVARDRFGVRPLYFAHHAGTLIVTNDLAALLATGDLAAALDETAITDFLLFAQGLDETKTTYACIGRIPAAHCAVFNEHGMRQRRYWSLPMPEAPRAISEGDAVEEFLDVFGRAVKDRVRDDRIALSLSGGVDSTVVAAMLPPRARAAAVTTGYEHFLRDDDHRFAAIAASSLGIPLQFVPADGYGLFERWDDPRCRGLEPVDTPFRAAFIDFWRALGERGRTVITGQGGDAVLYASHRHFVDLVRRGRILRAAREALGYAMTRRRMPPLLFRSHLTRALHLASDEPPFPPWMRAALRERWREVWSWRARAKALHRWRPEAAHFARQPAWPNAFQSYDHAWTGVRAAVTTPFFDLRVVEFLFSLPPMPHFADKDIVRRAMAGRLPDTVRLRPKTPLGPDPAEVLIRQELDRWLPLVSDSAVAAYVDTRMLTESLTSAGVQGRTMYQIVPVFALTMWMTYR